MKGGGGGPACLLCVCECSSESAGDKVPPSLTLGPSLLALGRSEAEELSASSLDLGVQRRRRRRRSEGIREAGPGLRRPRAKRGGGGGNYYNSYKSTKERRARRDEGIEKMEEEESSTNVRGKKEGRGGGGGKGNLEFPVHRLSSSSASFLLSSVAEDTSDYPCLRPSLLLRLASSSSALRRHSTHTCALQVLSKVRKRKRKKNRGGERKKLQQTHWGSEESCCDCYPWWTGFLVGGWRWLLAYERGKGEEENQLEEEPASETGEN